MGASNMVSVLLVTGLLLVVGATGGTETFRAPDSWVREAEILQREEAEQEHPSLRDVEGWNLNQIPDLHIGYGRQYTVPSRQVRRSLLIPGMTVAQRMSPVGSSSPTHGDPVAEDLVRLLWDLGDWRGQSNNRMRRRKKEEESTTFIKKTLLPYPRLG